MPNVLMKPGLRFILKQASYHCFATSRSRRIGISAILVGQRLLWVVQVQTFCRRWYKVVRKAPRRAAPSGAQRQSLPRARVPGSFLGHVQAARGFLICHLCVRFCSEPRRSSRKTQDQKWESRHPSRSLMSAAFRFFRASIGRDDEEKVPPCLVNTEQEQI